MIKADSPCLWEIRRLMGAVKTKAIVIYALVWAAELVNVERNLTEAQIGECAGDILEEYGYLKLEEVKYVLKRAVKTEKIFGRLDYNVVMGWFEAYDAERTEEAIRLSEQRESEELNAPVDNPGAVTFEEYVGILRERAANGDGEAAELVREIDNPGTRASSPTADDRRGRELAYKQWFYNEYLKKH